MPDQSCPQCRWVTVVDGSGRRRLEMQWTRPGTVSRLASPAAAAARAA
jgi:hypothetical protein